MKGVELMGMSLEAVKELSLEQRKAAARRLVEQNPEATHGDYFKLATRIGGEAMRGIPDMKEAIQEARKYEPLTDFFLLCGRIAAQKNRKK